VVRDNQIKLILCKDFKQRSREAGVRGLTSVDLIRVVRPCFGTYLYQISIKNCIAEMRCISEDLIWTNIISYLDVDDFKALRLSSKLLGLTDPKFGSHLTLRIDKVPFFCDNDLRNFTEEMIHKWLFKRTKLIINDRHVKLSAIAIDYLVSHGFLDSITNVAVYDSHCHRPAIEHLTRLPNLQSLKLVDQCEEESSETEELESILLNVRNMSSSTLLNLDVDFDSVLSGTRLSFLRGLDKLNHLRLRGFDLSDGLCNLSSLNNLETLLLCHGNFFSSPDDDVNEKDLTDLVGLRKLTTVHLEGFDCLSGIGLAPFCTIGLKSLVMKHCQELSEECFPTLGKMTSLNALHIVNSACDDVNPIPRDKLEHLNTLSELNCLSLFYTLDDPADLQVLLGLSSLETLNLAFEEDLDSEELEVLCTILVQNIPSLKLLRMFSENHDMEYDFEYLGLQVECCQFRFGDLVFV